MRRLALLAVGAWLAAAAACATAPARPAPPPEPPSRRVCLWLFWSKDPAIIKQAQEMMRQGQPFQLVAIGLVRSNPRLASTNADCTDTSKLEPQVTAALAELRLGQVSKPIPLNQGLALAMRTSDRFRREAKAYFDRRLYKQAIDSLRLDLELHPAAVGSWHLLALSLAATGQRQEAVKAFDQALEWSPDDPALLSDKATTLQSLGRGAEAVKLYREALARQPDNPVYLNNLAWALVQENQDLEQAERLAARAARQAPDQVSIWDTLGQVQQARGRHAQAVISFYTAARLNPKYPRIQERLNRSLLALRPDEVARLVPSLAAAVAPPPAPAARPAPAPAAKPKAKPEAPLLPPVRAGWSSAAAAAEQRPPLLSSPAPEKPAPAPAAPKPRPKPKTKPKPKPKPAPAPAPAETAPVKAPEPAKAAAAPAPAPEPVKAAPAPAPAEPAKTAPAPAPAAPPAAAAPELASGKVVRGSMPAPPPPPTAPAATAAAQTSPAPAPAPPPAPLAGRYYLQVASFHSQAQAEKGARDWQKQGYAAAVRAWSSPGQATWYRVLLGPFPSPQEALDQARQLTNRGLIKFYVLTKIP